MQGKAKHPNNQIAANNCTLFGIKSKKPKNKDIIKIAIVGAGIGGLFAAIALLSKFKDKVEVSIFEKQDDMERGVELSIGPAFQLALLEMGVDVKVLRNVGYPLTHDQRVRNTKFEVLETLEKEFTGQHTGFYTDLTLDDNSAERLQLYEYSTKRGILMDFLHKELLKLNDQQELLHLNCNLQNILTSQTQKQTLVFENGLMTDEFDLVIGADGVHSQVRKLLFDTEPPRHVGANILYGVIPGDLTKYEPNTFHVIEGQLTIVLSRYIESNGEISTWWAAIYPDQKHTDDLNVAFWEKRNDPKFIKKFASNLAEKNNNTVLKDLIAQTPNENFKYSGKFLERDPLALENWGKNSVLLIGDAIHAMMPWAGVGASMAAEDILILLSLFQKYKVLENRETFERALTDNTISKIYDEYKQSRINRIHYFYHMAHQMAPDGIISTENVSSYKIDIKKEYGNQHALTAVPHFYQLLDNQLSTLTARNEFFEKALPVEEDSQQDQQYYRCRF